MLYEDEVYNYKFWDCLVFAVGWCENYKLCQPFLCHPITFCNFFNNLPIDCLLLGFHSVGGFSWLDMQLGWGENKCMKNFGSEPHWKCALRRPKSRQENNTKMDRREPCYEDSRWMRLTSNCI
jgi:hypothetical protein